MSQRTADDLENRRGLTLGLTLAEVLLLLVFLVMLAFGWRMTTLERDQQIARAILERENTRLQRANADLTSALRGVRAIGASVEALKAADAAIAAAVEINPNNPAEVLERAVATLKRLGPDTRPDQVKPLSEMLTESEKLKTLDRAITLAMQLNPDDPAEALTRAAEVLTRLGADTKPAEVMPIEQILALSSQLDRAVSERDNLMHTGNGLTYPSCWRTAEGKTEYMLDITIQDAGLILRNATPSRTNDPAMRFVAGMARNELVTENAFRGGTAELFNYSKGQNCRFYSIVRDDTGSKSKARYKELISIVENHFYFLLRSDPWTDAPIGGPLQAAKR
jgi:hypothetical protein